MQGRPHTRAEQRRASLNKVEESSAGAVAELRWATARGARVECSYCYEGQGL